MTSRAEQEDRDRGPNAVEQRRSGLLPSPVAGSAPESATSVPESGMRSRYPARLSRIWSADLCQMKGLGFSFQLATHISTERIKSGTLWCVPRRSHLLVSSANQRSTRFHPGAVGRRENGR